MYTAPEEQSSIFRRTVATIDLDAFRENIRTIRSRIGETSRLIAVLKADGYGHGAVPLARVCESEQVSMVAVVMLEEAIALRRDGISGPVLLFGPLDVEGVAAAAEHSLALGTPSPETLQAIAAWTRQTNRGIGIHLHLDSGMNRMGLTKADLPGAVVLLKAHPGISVEGVFSHYANASDPKDPFNEVQEKRFDEMLGILRDVGIESATHHFANSAAAVTGRVRKGDWVRVGLALYGGEPLDYGESRLAPIMRWTTTIERIKDVAAGEIVGYGKAWTADGLSRIATLPVGYADGYSRLLSNNGDVLVRGRRVPIVGRVSMDLITIDVTTVPDAAVGDEVVLLGVQGDESIRAEEIATRTGTIPYEVFTNVSKRVPRVYVGETGTGNGERGTAGG